MFKAGDTIKIEKEFVLKYKGENWFEINGEYFCEDELLALGAVKVRKYYTEEELREKFRQINLNHLTVTMLLALDITQHDNRRTRMACIYMAMGYKKENGLWYKEGEE